MALRHRFIQVHLPALGTATVFVGVAASAGDAALAYPSQLRDIKAASPADTTPPPPVVLRNSFIAAAFGSPDGATATSPSYALKSLTQLRATPVVKRAVSFQLLGYPAAYNTSQVQGKKHGVLAP